MFVLVQEGARAQPEAEAILPASPPRQVYVKTRKGQATEAKLEHASSQQPKLHTLDDTFASPAEAEKEASPTLDRSAANNPHGHAPNAESAVEVKVDFADASAQSAVEVKVDLADNVGDCDNWVCLQRGKASYKAGKGPNQLAASHHEAGDGKVHVYVHQDLLQ